MSSKPILIIKISGGKIGVRARVDDDFIENEIELNPILAVYKRNNDPIIEKFLDLFESVIKRTVNEFMPHKNLYIKYKFITDDILSKSSILSVNLLEIKADDVVFRLDGGEFTISTWDNKSKNNNEAKPMDKTVEKTIQTPNIIFKKYKEQYDKRQKELKNKKPNRQYVGEKL